MKSDARWQDWLNLVLGVWLFLAPIVGVGAATGAAAWNAYATGALIGLFSIWALVKPEQWEEWINLVVGLWVIAAPFLLVFTGDTAALWNHLIVGVVVASDALWAAVSRPAASKAV